MNFVRKRDGKLERFDKKRITDAIWKAAKAVGGRNYKIAEKISGDVITELINYFGEIIYL